MSEKVAAKPSDIIVKFLQEIVDSWKSKRYQKVTEQCVALLKRKKTIENLGMTIPLQRILLQAYLHQDRYDKVLEWEKTTATSPTAKTTNGCDDLVLYARYRTEDYATVSKQAAAAATAAGAANDGDDQSNAVAFKHLRVQSEFHLNRTKEGLSGYLDMLSNDSIIDENDVESKLEILTNALAIIASSGCTPTVALKDETTNAWLEKAEALLMVRDDTDDVDVDVDDEMFADLASNLGCIRVLTDPTTEETDWLEEAAGTATGRDGDTDAGQSKQGSSSEETNLQWSKHFWYKDLEDVRYDGVLASSSSKKSNNSSSKPTAAQSVAKLNQSLLDENLSRLPPQPHPKWNVMQVRMYWYDRAVLQLKAGKYVECYDSCQSLKKTLSKSVSAPQGKKKKNKGNAAAGSEAATATSAGSGYKPTSPATLWWEARADVVLAYAQQAQSKHKDASTRLSESLESLRAAQAVPSLVVDHAVAHVQLHQFVMEQKGNKKDRTKQKRESLKLLKALPESIQSCPAVQLTIDDLETAVSNDAASSSGKANSTPKSPLEEADMMFGQGQYDEACKLYEGALSNSGSDSSPDIMDSQLRYVQALAMTGQHEASQELWQSLESALLEENTPTAVALPNGAALENKTLPRGTTGSIGNKLAAASNAAKEEEDKANKRSREKILRRRARKKEAYLKELESKGNYNPDRPTKPDPERWIPKHERSRSGRNRGERNNNNKGINSAQGGGSRLDAQRLDAAARRAGKVSASAGPSSANLKVSSGGRKGGRRR